jgi:type VI secretion system secreted protein Hcp
MAYDMFIDIEGIPGESTDAKLKDKINVFGFTWGVAQQGSFSHGNTSAVGKADIRSLRFLKRTDASSHLLFINCVTGAHIKQATLIVRKQGGSPLEFLKIQMNDIVVESFEFTGKPSIENTHPEEEVGLAFSSVKILYAKQKDERSLDAYKEVGWSLKENKRL